MRDACARSGTICASVMCLGSHGISRLQVWVNLVIFSFGRVVMIGLAAGIIFTAGVLVIKKYPVAPESEISHVTALATLSWLKTVFACGNYLNFLAWTMCCHAYFLVAVRDNKLVAGRRVVGITVG